MFYIRILSTVVSLSYCIYVQLCYLHIFVEIPIGPTDNQVHVTTCIKLTN